MHPTRNLFAEFKRNNKVFVETGSYRGDGIQLALDAGYERVISMDNSIDAFNFCLSRFDLYNDSNPGILLYQKDSAVVLYDAIESINEPITFWLDSHWQMLEDEPQGDHPWPLFYELNQIAAHPVKTHTIIIDDILFLTHPDVTGWTKKMIEEKILKINPKYKIEYYANPIINNILVASI